MCEGRRRFFEDDEIDGVRAELGGRRFEQHKAAAPPFGR
jgi:hypothetical protein